MKTLFLTHALGVFVVMFGFINCIHQTVAAPVEVSRRSMSSDCIDNYHVWPYAIWKHLCSDQTAGKRTDKIEKSFLASENSVDQIENLKNEEVELFVKYLLYNPQKLHQWLQDNSDMM